MYFTGASAGIYVSRDSGSSWENFSSGFNSAARFNYGLMALDSLTIIALQGTGIYRLQYTPSIHIVSPNGGEQRMTLAQFRNSSRRYGNARLEVLGSIPAGGTSVVAGSGVVVQIFVHDLQ